MSQRVRGAATSDAAAIGDAHAESWRIGYAELFPAEQLAVAVQRRRSMWPEFIDQARSSGQQLLVVEDAAGVAGFVNYGPARDGSGDAEVYAFYLHPRAWGSGAALALMDAALAQLAAGDRDRVVLWTHGVGRAASFYDKTGWRRTGRTRVDNLNDDVTFPVVEYARALTRS